MSNLISDRLRGSDESEIPATNDQITDEPVISQQSIASVPATPFGGPSSSDHGSLSGEPAQSGYQAASTLNETTPNSVFQMATPTAPVAPRTIASIYAPSPFAEITPELAASSPSELAVDIASAILSQLTTASTAAVTSNAAVSNPVGK